MNTIKKKILVAFFASLFLLSPFSFSLSSGTLSLGAEVYAQTATGGGSEPVATGGGSSAQHLQIVKLHNPLGDGGIHDIPSFIKALLEIVLKIGVPLVALAIIYTGYLFIAAQGNPEKLKKAKEALVYVFVGSIILLGAYAIAQAIQGTVDAIRGV